MSWEGQVGRQQGQDPQLGVGEVDDPPSMEAVSPIRRWIPASRAPNTPGPAPPQELLGLLHEYWAPAVS